MKSWKLQRFTIDPSKKGEAHVLCEMRQECRSTLALTLYLCLGISVVINVGGQVLLNVANGGTFLMVTLLNCVPNIFLCAGMLLFYSAYKKPNFGILDTKGLTRCKVGVILMMILIPAALIVMGVVGFLGSAHSINGVMHVVGPLMVVFGLVFAATCILPLRTVQSIKNAAITGRYDGNISLVFILLLFFSAICSFGGMMNNFNPIQLPGMILSAGTALLIGILLNRLRLKLVYFPLVAQRPIQ